MAQPEKNWVTVARSRFPWEQEALDYVYGQFPTQDNYRAWANFEFIADDGSINEVDLLIACPNGIFLTEIKSKPGVVSGDAMNWTWEHEGKRHTTENPLLLANRKCVVAHRPERPAILSLGGRGWQVESLDWSKRVAYVVPMEGKGKGQWLTSSFGLSYRISQAIRDVLSGKEVSARWSTRARERISELRNTYYFVDRTNDAVVVASESRQLEWYTFAGNMINQAIAGSLIRHGYDDVKADDFRIQVLSTIDHQKLIETIRHLTAAGVIETFLVPDEFLDQLKFSECLPKQMAESIVKSRCLNSGHIDSVLRAAIVVRASQ